MKSTAKKNKLLLVLSACVIIAAVFFMLNETFAWLSFFKAGQGQKFEAGYIETFWEDSYETYLVGGVQTSAKGKYKYLPGDDLCMGKQLGDTQDFERLGFNLKFRYVTQSNCVVRFKVEYQNTYYDEVGDEYVTNALKPAFDKNYVYAGANLTARDKSMVLVSFAGGFVHGGVEAGMTYWYYGKGGGVSPITDTVLTSTAGAYINSNNNILTKLELAGDNIEYEGEASGKITIKITAQIRQHEAGEPSLTWANYKETQFVL